MSLGYPPLFRSICYWDFLFSPPDFRLLQVSFSLWPEADGHKGKSYLFVPDLVDCQEGVLPENAATQFWSFVEGFDLLHMMHDFSLFKVPQIHWLIH